ncbi:MAG: hypothetical protein AAGF11_56755, partial [Myxococcota bacterium]
MSAIGSAPDTERPSALRFLGELLFRNWGLKAIAFVLAAIMFVSTRDEVTRVFTVPLKVVPDPDRVLQTELPQSIQVQARGPWTRINRLQDYDFGVATLDLKVARPGPLEVDQAAIVMPSGVVLVNTLYDHVDLRFDPVIEREVDVESNIVGDPAPDYELVRVEVQPTRWRIRGGESVARAVPKLLTEELEIQGADHDVEASRAVLRPPKGVRLVGAERDEATVTVRAIIQAKRQARRVVVSVPVSEAIDPTGAVPRTYEVELSGPRPDFRVLDGLGLDAPVQAELARVEGEGKGGGVVE